MDRNIGKTVIKMAVLSLVIGLFLTFFDITPAGLLRSFGSTIQQIFDIVASFIEWSIGYILVGAVVVVPIWLFLYLMRVAREKK